MSEQVPPWLLEMRALTGTAEVSGSGNNPQILAMADFIADRYPEMATYCALYTADEIAWCGLATAYCLARAGIRPVFGPTDTDKFLWAQAFDDEDWGYLLGAPRPGCIVVMTREGGGHVTLYERTEGSNYVCRGGNQSDQVNQQSYAISTVIALLWPKQAGTPPPAPRRALEEGDSGADVEYLQDALGIPPDGEFGPVTKSAVKGFQVGTGLVADGVCGPATWVKVDNLVVRVDTGTDDLDDDVQGRITSLALASPIQEYTWKDRGKSPVGYVSGMGQCYALALARFLEDDPAAIEMAQAEGEPDLDALAYYKDAFDDLGMDNSRPGAPTLRNLFTLMIGLGMRETSGKYCEGRDMSASNTSSETCEAGLFQTSWNIRTASPNIPTLLEEYWADPNGFLGIFSEGITPTVNNLDNYGTGQGASYQFLAKYSPAFATLVTAIGLRTRRAHWGPIGRREVELVEEAGEFLRQVETLVREYPVTPAPGPDPEPPPKPEPASAFVDVVTSGPVSVSVNGTPVSSWRR